MAIERLDTTHGTRLSVQLGGYEDHFHSTLKALSEKQVVRRLWTKDTTLWKQEPKHQKIIANSLGWLTIADFMLERIAELTSFTAQVKEQDFKHAVVLGMGGSSLCPEVFRRTFGKQPDHPEVLVLDSTDPATIGHIQEQIDPRYTLFIVASKSGSTIEPLSFYSYFYEVVAGVKDQPGKNFVAVTDPGSMLEGIGCDKNFLRVFLNPADIGGRYSALSYFGMVPGAVAGLDIRELLSRARDIGEVCRSEEFEENPGVQLGAELGGLAQQGRDKVTLVIPEPLSSLGLWIEQLVAESTGKENIGILPVTDEPLSHPDNYGNDRLFVYIGIGSSVDREVGPQLDALATAGHPVIRRLLKDPMSIGAEMLVWEIATAVAGHILKINPFDQPNVQESKDNTNALLAHQRESGRLPESGWSHVLSGITAYADEGGYRRLVESSGNVEPASLEDLLYAHLSRVKPGDYIALTAYFLENERHDALLRGMRVLLRDALKVATTAGYGPRFLHSTGQLHKGGADNGVFIQLTAENVVDYPVPDQDYSFSVLKQAQALGDFQALANRKRRVIGLNLGSDVANGLEVLHQALGVVVLSF